MPVWWGGDTPYLQGLGQSYEIPLHLLTGLQLSLQPQHLCPLFREEVCELGLGAQDIELGPWAEETGCLDRVTPSISPRSSPLLCGPSPVAASGLPAAWPKGDIKGSRGW